MDQFNGGSIARPLIFPRYFHTNFRSGFAERSMESNILYEEKVWSVLLNYFRSITCWSFVGPEYCDRILRR